MSVEVPSAGPELSVVIAAHDAAGTLGAQLDALLDQSWTGAWELVVVDNRSTDATAALVREYAARDPRVRLVSASASSGPSYARNAGIAAAMGDHLAVCDADDVVGDRWLAAMGDGLREHACVTGPLDVDRLNPAALARTRGVFPADRCQSWYGVFDIVPAGNFGIRREEWDRAGGFDEELRACEDHDLSFRLRLLGVPVAFLADAVVHYRYRPTATELWRQGSVYGSFAPLLRRRVREAGLEPPPRWAGWRSWLWLVAHLPGLWSAAGRRKWVWVAAVRLGHLRGSVRARSVFL